MFRGREKARNVCSRAKFAIKIPPRWCVRARNSSRARIRAKPFTLICFMGRYLGRLLIILVVLCQSNHCTMQNEWRKSETARRTFGRESRWSIARRKYRTVLGHLRRGKLYHLLCATVVHFRNLRAVDARLYGIC